MTAQRLAGATARGSALALVGLAAACALSWSLPAALGVLAGGALGLIPIVTWAMIAGPVFARKRPSLTFVALLLAAKLAIYGAVLYALVTQQRVDALAFAIGLLVPHLVMAWKAARAPQKVAA
jgi:ATP synthase I subunit